MALRCLQDEVEAQVTECKEVGYKPIPGADHKHPVYHYEMAAGDVWRKTDEGDWEVVRIDKGTAAKAEQVFCLHFVKGQTAAEFTVGGRTYAQPIPGEGGAKAAPRPKAKEKSIAAQVREERAARKAPAPPAPPPKEPAAPPKAAPKKEPAPPAPKKRKGYGLDF